MRSPPRITTRDRMHTFHVWQVFDFPQPTLAYHDTLSGSYDTLSSPWASWRACDAI
ncbi:hypothetical protein P153DRAFT_370282 [Dothidotthia symphoricarpi CBS 119687]|uniref:Uncharacterized protein n=1 Tax=Dothidotthia symphoricarpi CBS 119687 TaxID=1392245 RepID=A0A6A6A1A9_9PLEO|nr:uncharacterized protein P153DRAFT_370282 [Dothidotthia symphoricarpi CBS 119687]KAF2124953.1 hypothetical protein P153DRAFT_370282 [Dothidotthia symphoricarpi CBS 119687]